MALRIDDAAERIRETLDLLLDMHPSFAGLTPVGINVDDGVAAVADGHSEARRFELAIDGARFSVTVAAVPA